MQEFHPNRTCELSMTLPMDPVTGKSHQIPAPARDAHALAALLPGQRVHVSVLDRVSATNKNSRS